MDKFILSLDSNRAGRLIQDHLASTEDRLDAQGREGAVKEVVTNRQVFMSALALSLARGAAHGAGATVQLVGFLAIPRGRTRAQGTSGSAPRAHAAPQRPHSWLSRAAGVQRPAKNGCDWWLAP